MTPALVQAGADWFRDIVGALHGSVARETRERMIRETFLSEVIMIGIDGGGLVNLLGLAVLGRGAITREWLLWSHA